MQVLARASLSLHPRQWGQKSVGDVQTPVPVWISLCPSPWSLTTKVLQSPILRQPLDPLWKETITEDNLQMCDVCMKAAASQNRKGGCTRTTLDCIEHGKNGTNKPPEGGRRNVSPGKLASTRPNGGWQSRELSNRKNTTGSGGPPELVLILSLILLDGVKYTWAKQDKYEAPKWAGDLWSASPMDHQQLATCMVCSWSLVKAYQQTHWNMFTSVCLHHMYWRHITIRLTMICTKSWICRSTQFYNMLTPCNTSAIVMMWGIRIDGHRWWSTSGQKWLSLLEVRTLQNSRPLPSPQHCYVHLNQGAKIPDYGVQEHIAFVCAPFFEGIESWSQYEKRRHRWEECWHVPRWLWGTTKPPPTVPAKGLESGMSEGLRQWDKEGRSHSKSRRRTRHKGAAEP